MIKRNKENPYAPKPIRGTNQDPLLIRVLEAENPQFKDAMRRLMGNGQTVTLMTTPKTPQPLIATLNRVKNAVSQGMGKEGDIPLLTAKTIVEKGSLAQGKAPSPEIQSDIQTVKEGIQHLTSLKAEGNHVDTQALATVNHFLQKDPTVQKYAVHRLTWDIPGEEQEGLKKTIRVGVAADILGFGAEFILPRYTTGFLKQAAEGAGLAITGQSDDAVASWGNFTTERGGGKKIPQILKENKLTLGMMLTAAAIDFSFLPAVFHHDAYLGTPKIDLGSPLPFHIDIPGHVVPTPLESITQNGLYWPALAGFTFAFTAYAGSLTSKWSNIRRSESTIKALDKQGLLPGREGKTNTLAPTKAFRLAFAENQSHPFRVGLLAGIGLSTIASLGASYGGILEGNPFLSSTVQAGIGPLETASAFVSAFWLAEPIYNKLKGSTNERQLRRRLRNAKGTPLDLTK